MPFGRGPLGRFPPTQESLSLVRFGAFRVRFGPFQARSVHFGSVSGLSWGVGSGRGGVVERGSEREKSITRLASLFKEVAVFRVWWC